MGYLVFDDYTVIYSKDEPYPRLEKGKSKVCINFDLIPYFEITPIDGNSEFVWLKIEDYDRYPIKISDLPSNLQL